MFEGRRNRLEPVGVSDLVLQAVGARRGPWSFLQEIFNHISVNSLGGVRRERSAGLKRER